MKELEFTEKLEQKDDRYVFSRIFRSELNKEECLKFKTGAEKNIVRIQEELDKHNEKHIQATLAELWGSVDHEVTLKREYLKDFNSYAKKAKRELEQKIIKQKSEFLEYIQNADNIKKEIEKRVREFAQTEKENLLEQLKDEEQIFKVYKEVA